MQNAQWKIWGAFAMSGLTVFSVLTMISCVESPEKEASAGLPTVKGDSVIAFNQRLVEVENQEIEDYIARYHWNMNKTQTGLRYMIYKQGSGPRPEKGITVGIRYAISLLNGDQVYQSDPARVYTFETGTGKVPSGLEEGVLLMNKGSRLKLIVPSHLALGLLGDLQKIPSRAVLVFDVELCEVSPPKK